MTFRCFEILLTQTAINTHKLIFVKNIGWHKRVCVDDDTVAVNPTRHSSIKKNESNISEYLYKQITIVVVVIIALLYLV